MPRFPSISSTLGSVGASLFSALARRIAAYPGETYPLHVGDTWVEPAEGCRMEDLRVSEHPGMHRYAPPRGLAPLLEAAARRSESRTGVPTTTEHVLVAAGATGGLCAVMGAILEPGEEVLVLAPYWPLITGVIRCARGVPVEVPFFGHAVSPESAVACLAPHLTSGTSAVYLSTPNNPTGGVIPPSWLEAIVTWARERGLWIVADEVYEDYVYRGEHAWARTFAPERTFSVHSLSKAFGMAGNRCGWVVGPADAMHGLCKVSTHAFYSTPTASQLAACNALEGPGDAWVARMKPRYREAGDRMAEVLGVPPPEGSTFLFLDVAARLDGRGLGGFLEDCADRGLFLAPGPSFGSYPTSVRVCFTAAEPAVIDRGARVLASLLGR
jgi:N-succinyldiaminopimelate aminotransferase